jgi:DNA-binding beta-propeller fold protein YncE
MKNLAIILSCLLLGACSLSGQQPAPLTLTATIELPGVTGKFDHFAIDETGNRLFAAATGNHSVEVINLADNKIEQSIPNLGKPHGLAWVPATKSLYVADGLLAELLWYQGMPLKRMGTIQLSDDADDMVYSEAKHRLYVGHGGTDAGNPARIAVIDTNLFKLKANIPVASHPEALDIDAADQRIFANIAQASEVAVIDGSSDAIVAHWKLSNVADNVPLGYDGETNTLFLAARSPASVLALDGTAGVERSRQPTASGADDLFYDPALHRVYVICGAGEVDVYKFDSAKSLHAAEVLRTEAGAKTALFVPSQMKLYLGIPAAQGHSATIRVYSTASGKGIQ